MSDVWAECGARARCIPLAGEVLRLVESQEQVATRGLVATLAEQELLESLLEASPDIVPQMGPRVCRCKGLRRRSRSDLRDPQSQVTGLLRGTTCGGAPARHAGTDLQLTQMTEKVPLAVLLVVFCLCALILSFGYNGQSPQGLPGPSPQEPKPEKPSLVLSILPVERAGEMYARFLPLKYYLEHALKQPVIIKVPKDFESAVRELVNGEVHMAYLDPATYCEARARHHDKVVPLVRAVTGGRATSRSVLVAKNDGAVRKVADLKGKRLALGTQQSTFSYLVPLAMLHDVGLGMKDFASVDFLQQEDRVALIVDESVDEERESRLDYWRGVIETGSFSDNDLVAAAWADTLTRYHIPRHYALQLIDGVNRDIFQARYQTFDELATYCYGVASTVGLTSMYIVGFKNNTAVPYAIKLGVALQMIPTSCAMWGRTTAMDVSIFRAKN